MPEQVRKHTLLSTLLMQSRRPQRKPPFTIEGAMSFLRRHKKENEEENEPQTEQPSVKQRRPKKASPAPPPPTTCQNESLVTSLRQAGSDRELRGPVEVDHQLSSRPVDDLPKMPDSDSEWESQSKKKVKVTTAGPANSRFILI